jgi:hypothetical protein
LFQKRRGKFLWTGVSRAKPANCDGIAETWHEAEPVTKVTRHLRTGPAVIGDGQLVKFGLPAAREENKMHNAIAASAHTCTSESQSDIIISRSASMASASMSNPAPAGLDSEGVRIGSLPEAVSFRLSVPHVPFQYPTDFNFSEESITIRAPILPLLDHSRLSSQQAALAEQVQKRYLEAEQGARDLLHLLYCHWIRIMRNSWMQWHRLPLLSDNSKTSSFPQPEAVQKQTPSVAATRSSAGYGTQSSSTLARDPALFHKLAEASISSLNRKDKRFMGEVFSRHVKPLGLSAKALASALHAIDHSKFPAQVSDADAECKLKEVDASNKGYANFEEFCRAAKISSNAGAETDTSAARDVFLRFVKGLSAQELVAALKEVDAPVLLSSEGSSPEQIYRRADINMSGSVDFAELDPSPMFLSFFAVMLVTLASGSCVQLSCPTTSK